MAAPSYDGPTVEAECPEGHTAEIAGEDMQEISANPWRGFCTACDTGVRWTPL